MSSSGLSPEPSQEPWVDLAFRIVAERIPIDHGYALYSALSGTLPALHYEIAFGLLPFRGSPQSPGWLQLGPESRLTLRVGATNIPKVIGLAGKRLNVNGVTLVVGVPEVFPLRPAKALVARIVTIKGFADDEGEFVGACQRQLRGMGVDTASLDIGRRRVMRVGGYTVVGFGVVVSGLNPGASLTLQRVGIGGKRKMGAGVFVPTVDHE